MYNITLYRFVYILCYENRKGKYMKNILTKSVAFLLCITLSASMSVFASDESSQTENSVFDEVTEELNANTMNMETGDSFEENVEEDLPEGNVDGDDISDDSNTDDDVLQEDSEVISETSDTPGWKEIEGNWYYYDADKNRASGWRLVKNVWYFFDGSNEEYPGIMLSDTICQIDGKYYGFNASGAMLTGWIERPEGWYYADQSGAFVMDWVKSKGLWYYLNPADEEYPGRMCADTNIEINGLPYVFLSTGAMKTGWDCVEGIWYYYDNYSGQLVSDWQKINGKWYYFDLETKQMAPAGWHEIDGTYYYMNTDGDMVTGWKWINGYWYYFGNNGAMREDWHQIDGLWYYFYKENDSHGGVHGAMAANTTIDGYKIQADGIYMTLVQQKMNALAQGHSSRTGYLLMVDTTNCSFGVFSGSRGNWKMIKSWACSPGAPETPTVKGVFSVGGKGYYFDSGDLRLYWYTQFYGDYLIHSVCYFHDGSPADLRTGYHLSHGCVRLHISNAKWVYDNIPGGTAVVCY